MVRKESTKRLSKVSKVLMASWSIPQANASAASYPVFSHTGIAYIYSNNPERIEITTGAYTIEKYLTAGSYYDVEFYHYAAVANRQVGIAIQNKGSSQATITISASAARKGQGYIAAAAVEQDYQNNLGSTTKIVAPNGCQWVLVPLSGLAVGEYAVGKVRLQSNTANVVLRVVYGPAGDGALTSMSTSYGVAPYTTPTTSFSGQTTGYFTHDGLATTVDYALMQSFTLPGWDSSLFPLPRPFVRNEYEDALSIPTPHGAYGPGSTPSSIVVPGNYGMAYAVTISGASGKHVTITPKRYPATIVVRVPPTSSWVTYTISGGDYPPFSINSASWVLGFVQPGGNSSNFTFEIS
jgi:hypothetical protein